MTTKELIERLQKLPEDDVCVLVGLDDGWQYSLHIGSIWVCCTTFD